MDFALTKLMLGPVDPWWSTGFTSKRPGNNHLTTIQNTLVIYLLKMLKGASNSSITYVNLWKFMTIRIPGPLE